MRFYKFTATVVDEKWAEENEDRRVKSERIGSLAACIETFNREKDGRFIFASKIEGGEIRGGVISSSPGDVEGFVAEFFKASDLGIGKTALSEITFSSVTSLLRAAERSGFIEDDEEILETLGLDEIGFRNNLDEAILPGPACKEDIYAAAEDLMAEETLFPELDRIYCGSRNPKAFGHPVHYYIESDGYETDKALSELLLRALCDNRRLVNRRYSVVDIFTDCQTSWNALGQLYESSADGAVIVRYSSIGSQDEESYATGEIETIERICELILKYRNRTLTLVDLPRTCEKTKKLFTERLGSLGMVEIRENLADAERAEKALKKFCRDRHIRYDKNLAGRLDEEKQYLPDELRAIFEEWYNEKMRTKIFPQYKNVTVSREQTAAEIARGSAIEDLNEMIGLRSAKDVIMKALSYYKLQRMYSDRGITQDRPAMHMAFMGNPGTAKTTVARLFARIMKENDLLSQGHLVEVGRGDLVGKYVGWTAPTVKKKFDQAMGGVLFIDEAYSLVDGKNGLFGDEAINTIVQEMENRREDLIVIFAGYPQEMEEFLSKNPGLRSRIAFHVPFADYDSDELCGIARMIAESKGVTLTDGAVAKLSVLFDSVRSQPDFGNGRYVRNVIELSKLNQASRILSLDPADITDRVLTSIEADDIEIPTIRSATQKRTIGFAS